MDTAIEELTKYNKILTLFDSHGNCKTLGDPYRDVRENNETLQFLFNEDGDLNYGIEDSLVRFVNKFNVNPLSDIVKLIISNRFASNTQYYYSTKFYWR